MSAMKMKMSCLKRNEQTKFVEFYSVFSTFLTKMKMIGILDKVGIDTPNFQSKL